MVPVRIEIQTIITYAHDEQEVIQQAFDGQFWEMGQEWKLFYIENEGTGQEIRTVLYAYPDSLTVVRKGEVAYQQVFLPGRRTESILSSPVGKFSLEIETFQYHRERGSLFYRFQLFSSDEKLGDYYTTINFFDKKQQLKEILYCKK